MPQMFRGVAHFASSKHTLLPLKCHSEGRFTFGSVRSARSSFANNLFFFFLRLAFTSYGAFWLSFATIFIPGSGIADAYASAPGMEDNALGIYLLAWMIVTILFL